MILKKKRKRKKSGLKKELCTIFLTSKKVSNMLYI